MNTIAEPLLEPDGNPKRDCTRHCCATPFCRVRESTPRISFTLWSWWAKALALLRSLLGHSLSKERRVFSVVDCSPMYSFHGRQVLSSSAYLPNGGAITCAMVCSWVSRMLSSTLAELSWAEWMVASGTQDVPCSLFRSFLRTSLFSFFVLIWSELRNAWMM